MTPEQRAALDRAKGPQKDLLRVYVPGYFKTKPTRDYRHEYENKRRGK